MTLYHLDDDFCSACGDPVATGCYCCPDCEAEFDDPALDEGEVVTVPALEVYL